MKSIALILLAGWLVVPAPAFAEARQSLVDFGDRAFTADDVVRALGSPRSRGLRLNKEYATNPPAVEDSGRKLSLQLQFAFASAELTPGSKRKLDALGEALTRAELAQSNLVVSGHTDVTGGYEYNVALSKRRAEAVKAYLVATHAVDAERLTTVGRGPEELLDESNPKSAVNRRVQLAVLE
jgi:outer membrane protein OmpA-like peptidoglycan-associated protein